MAIAVGTLLLCVLLGLNTQPESKPGEVIIDVWHPWGGETSDDFLKAVRRFNDTHPGIKVRPLFVPNDLANSQKFYIAVAGGVPPDVMFVDGPQVAEWAQKGILLPLDDLLPQAGILPEDFWEPCWKQTVYEGQIYALTYCADPNFAFFWNKDLFRKAGLDPDQPPRTFEEMDRIAEKITVMTETRMERMGLIPWGVYGYANSLFTWGWAFGGSFYDEANKRVTATDPKVLQALKWMCSYGEKYGVNRISALQSTFGSGEQDPFIMEKLGMQPYHIGSYNQLRRYAPDLEVGACALPQPEGGEANSSWVGGWCIGIPAGSGTHVKEAFEFIRWICVSEEGTALVAKSTGSFPGCKRSPVYEEIKKDPIKVAFLEILQECRHQRPVMPAQAFYMNELETAVDRALYGKETPEKALERAQQKTQEHLDKVLGRVGKGSS